MLLCLAIQVCFVAASQSRFAVPSDDYTVYTHDHSDHKLRIKDVSAQSSLTDYCAGATSGYTGYLSTDNDTKHFYFAYFESRKDPANDPLVMWINGGPGCSSMTGLLMELGPCEIVDDSTTVANKHSWIETANMFFLDQPLGVGFSYSSNKTLHGGEGGTRAARQDILAFMRLWYQAFPKSRSLPFTIAGESYGGHYIPMFADHIIKHNEISSDKIPLKSVMIGNGMYEESTQVTSSWDISCTNFTGYGPILNEKQCTKMSKDVKRCEYLGKACQAYPDEIICDAAADFCERTMMRPYEKTGRNFYDVSKPCEGYLCYPILSALETYLRKPEVRDAFGVDKAAPKFVGCSEKVGREFNKVRDIYEDTTPYLASILDHGVSALIYTGVLDWICAAPGGERVMQNMEWSHSAEFRYAQENDRRDWAGGVYWEAKNLRYARVHGAGHMVPYDQSETSLALVTSFLRGKELK